MPTKAYANPTFLMGEDAREVRILCEYLEPRTRLRQAGVRRGIAFFGSARLRPGGVPDYCAQASALAERLARWTCETHAPGQRFHFCTGGGPGVMEAASAGVARVDRSLNVGLNISLPHEQHANPWLLPELVFEFHYFFMRKFWFSNLAQAVVAFPGGFGTFDELFEMLTLLQTGKIAPRPVVLFGRQFWNDVVDFDQLARSGVIAESDTRLALCTDDMDEALDYIRLHAADAEGPALLAPLG